LHFDNDDEEEPKYSQYEGCVRLEEGGTWYYHTSTPDLDASDSDEGDGSIKMLREYVSEEGWIQQYYNLSVRTAYSEPLPPAP